ncbi:hypothetical protein UK23_06180 [Lentzea aerocolonigenes]|uniref:Nucleotidyltransferase family protein n=1 Tax=Lentzea aerocolonigenes TaxID=68170 RepID=A0A0F0H862_LENAE|nr:nucleotidyltransferase family protein [Lentzea aerocolonigenes]KJK51695.1 hypothetical protein UK23_06180 [Lentzea aerocolonigenes]
MSTIGAEAAWKLVALSSIHDVAADMPDVDVDEILAEVDWDVVLVRAMRHRLMPRLADLLIRSERMAATPKPIRRALVLALNTNRFTCAATTRETSEVVAALQAGGVAVACTKGVVFQQSLYGGFGGRDFRDIDLMIQESDKQTAAEILLSIGYEAHLELDLLTNTTVTRSRRELMMYRMFPDHLPHFARPVEGHIMPFHDVDVCFNFTWHGAGWNIPMNEVLAELDTVEVRAGEETFGLPSLSAPYDFLFVATHIFRETWFERKISGEAIRLGQFADLWRLWQRLDDPARKTVAALIDRYGVAPPIAWACHHADGVFGSRIADGLGLGDYCDSAWLRSIGAVDGSYLEWHGDMREWLRSGKPPALSPMSEPRFAAQARVALS